MIKVLQLTRNLGIGGLEKVIFDLCKRMDKARFDVRVCCLHWKGEFGERLEKMGIQVQVLPGAKQVDYFGFLKIARVLRQFKPDIVHTHNSHAFIDGTLASIVSGTSLVVNTDHARNFPDKKRIMIAERACAGFAGKIVAVSDHTRDELVRYERIPRAKIDVIQNGIDPDKYAIEIDKQRKMAELGIGDRIPILGLGVRLTPQKGIEYLLKAMVSLIPRFPKILLVIAGKGELLEDLQRLSKELGVEKHVSFLGARMDWNEILQLLDLYVLPSVWEGMPLAVLEAMAAKKPIVATRVGGVSSVISHNVSGLLVPAGDPSLLAESLLTVLCDDLLAARIAEGARKSFLESFTVDKMVEHYEQLYWNLMTQGRASASDH